MNGDRPMRDSILSYWMKCRDPYSNPGGFGRIHSLDLQLGGHSWAPLELLVASLDRLQQFTFVAKNQLTSGLEEAISHYQPNCSVDIIFPQILGCHALDQEARDRLVRRQLGLPWTDEEMNSDTLSLSGLRTLAVKIVCPQDGEDDFDEILPFLLTPPGLKHLKIEMHWSLAEDPFDNRLETLSMAPLKEKWQEMQNRCPPKQQSRLESLTISGRGPPETVISKLATVGDLSSVRTLIIPWQYLLEVRDTGNLGRIAGVFPNLERLFIKPNTIVERDTRLGTDVEDAIDSIRSFRPLKYLCLYSLCSVGNLHRIIDRHGQSLRGLTIEPSGETQFDYPRLAKSDIERLVAACPNLQELRIQIKRSQGSRAECDLYEALGKFSNLHSLMLDLNFDGREAPPALSDAHQPSSYVSDDTLRGTFRNAAIDEKLALGIWNLITANKSSCLRRLRIVPFGGDRFPPPEHHMLSQLARSFLVTGPNAQSPEVPMVEEIHPKPEISWGPYRPDRCKSRWTKAQHARSEAVTPIIHELWPQLQRSRNWKSDLASSSFPLEAGSM